MLIYFQYFISNHDIQEQNDIFFSWSHSLCICLGERKIFWKLPRICFSDTLGVENFDEITLSGTVKEIEANLCFSIFLAKMWKYKMATIFREGKFFWKLQRVHCSDTLWVENFDEIALSRTVKEIEANLCFAIFGKVAK